MDDICTCVYIEIFFYIINLLGFIISPLNEIQVILIQRINRTFLTFIIVNVKGSAVKSIPTKSIDDCLRLQENSSFTTDHGPSNNHI